MTDQRIRPEKITKPIQLLAAWLIGLVLVNGAFLAAAPLVSEPKWAAGLLVIAAVANVPLFLFALFLLQTRFRPEMQEDTYYSQYLERKAKSMALVLQNETLQKENRSLRAAPPTTSGFKLIEEPKEAGMPEGSPALSLETLEMQARARLEKAGAVDDAAVQEVVHQIRQDQVANERKTHDRVRQTMSKFHDWLVTVGFTDLPDLPEIVIEPPSYLNAHYYDGKARFGSAIADDPDIVAQINFMTVLERIAPHSDTADAGAVFLGTADYFACSYTGNPKLGERFAQVTGFGMGSIRNLAELAHIRDATDRWTRSLVWSGACWELREQYGGDALNDSVRVIISKFGRDTSVKEAAILLTNELSRAIDDQAGDTARNVFQKRGIILVDRSADETGQSISVKSEEKLAIPDNDPLGVVSRLLVEQDGKLRNISVDVDISHTYIGDLRIVLVSPSGREVVLHDRIGASGDDINATFDVHKVPDLETLIQNEESVRGEWHLRVADFAERDTGEINTWGLKLIAAQ